jgi:hypothetical protein
LSYHRCGEVKAGLTIVGLGELVCRVAGDDVFAKK